MSKQSIEYYMHMQSIGVLESDQKGVLERRRY